MKHHIWPADGSNGQRPGLFGRVADFVSQLIDYFYARFIHLYTTQSGLRRALDAAPDRVNLAAAERELIRQDALLLDRLMGNEITEDEVLTLCAVKEEGAARRIFAQALRRLVQQRKAYTRLESRVESLCSESYDSTNAEHEALLMKLWRTMMPHQPNIARISKDWGKIGFQGDDPATDFRGMGILGLQQLVFFAETEPEQVARILLLSHHPTIGFPFACAGVTITSLCRALLRADRLRNHFYNLDIDNLENDQHAVDNLEEFHHVYACIFILFADYWKRANPQSVMQFNEVRVEFELSLSKELDRDTANLKKMGVEDL